MNAFILAYQCQGHTLALSHTCCIEKPQDVVAYLHKLVFQAGEKPVQTMWREAKQLKTGSDIIAPTRTAFKTDR